MSSTTHKILGFLFELAQMLHILLSERLLHLSQNNTLCLSCLIDFNKLSMSPSSLLTKCKANLSAVLFPIPGSFDISSTAFDNNFEEIAPLISSFDFDIEKQKSDFEILNYESLPESVYMIVDKKVELELQPISDLPEWSFLPENELKRNAILLFSNQRSAKRICSRNQRVIKIPNTSIFKLSKPYLISMGITRLILEDSIIGLDD